MGRLVIKAGSAVAGWRAMPMVLRPRALAVFGRRPWFEHTSRAISPGGRKANLRNPDVRRKDDSAVSGSDAKEHLLDRRNRFGDRHCAALETPQKPLHFSASPPGEMRLCQWQKSLQLVDEARCDFAGSLHPQVPANHHQVIDYILASHRMSVSWSKVISHIADQRLSCGRRNARAGNS
jgi:hypothetical protein